MGYNRLARAQYGLFRLALRLTAPVKPLYRLALRVLTHSPKHVRGHILPVNEPLGSPRLASLSRGVLAELVEKSSALALMHGCMCRELGNCTDYPHDIGCLVLGEAVHRLHPGLGREVTKAEALAQVDRALAANLTPMVIHMNGDALLWSLQYERMLTVCFCCPCHCLVRRAVTAGHPEISAGITALPGVRVALDERTCVGCGICEQHCFTQAIAVREGKAAIDTEKCVACGRCAMACPLGALRVDVAQEFSAAPVLSEYNRRTGGVFTPGAPPRVDT